MKEPELRRPSTGAVLAPQDQRVAWLAAEGVLVAGMPQDARAYRPSPLGRTVVTAALLDAERGNR